MKAAAAPRRPKWLVQIRRAALCCCCLGAIVAAAVFFIAPAVQQLSGGATTAVPSSELKPTAATTPSPSPSPPARPSFDVAKLARALDPEVMDVTQHLLTSRMEGLKNPCWKAPGSDVARCLPYVYLTGSFQAGAGTLYEKLAQHPDIIHNEVTRWQFWGEEGKPMAEYSEKNGRSLPKLQKDPGRKVLLDASASTFAFYWSAGLRTHQAFQKIIRPCWANCSDAAKGKQAARRRCMEEICHPAAMAADKKMASDNGATYDDLHLPLLMAAAYGAPASSAHLPKVIVLVRNPIDRIHSAYWGYAHYKGKYGETAQGFLKYVEEQVGALRKCESRGFSARECALYFEALGVDEEQLFFHADQFIRGMYALFLEVWLRHFPRDHVLVLKSEDFFADAGGTLAKVYAFLGLEAPKDEETAGRISKAGRPSSAATGKPAMLPQARELLLDLYRPWNKQLSQLTGDPSYESWS